MTPEETNARIAVIADLVKIVIRPSMLLILVGAILVFATLRVYDKANQRAAEVQKLRIIELSTHKDEILVNSQTQPRILDEERPAE